MSHQLTEDALALVVSHCRHSPPSLKSLFRSSVLLSRLARWYAFQYLRLPVEEDHMADVMKLVRDKPYLVANTRRIRLFGKQRRGRYPTISITDVDVLLYTLWQQPVAVGLSNFRWRSAPGGLRSLLPLTELAVDCVEGEGILDSPSTLLHAFGNTANLRVSGLAFHPQSFFPGGVAGGILADSCDVDMVGNWRRNAVDGLHVSGLAELCCRGIQFQHVDWIRYTVNGSRAQLERVTLMLDPNVVATNDWEEVGLQVCEQLRALVLVVTLPLLDPHEQTAVVICMILQFLPDSLTYLEIRFKLAEDTPLSLCTLRPADMPWDLYSLILGLQPNLVKVLLYLIHEDPTVCWREEERAGIEEHFAAVDMRDIEFRSRSSLVVDGHKRWDRPGDNS